MGSFLSWGSDVKLREGDGGADLAVPIYLKTSEEMPWPENERAFYLLSQSGIFLCRNHPFFRSSVHAPSWPGELARHDRSLSLRLPRIPRRHVELAVGFFARVAEAWGGEAGVLLVWDEKSRRLRYQVPEQRATVRASRNGVYTPVSLSYVMTETLAPGCTVIGDMHSHAEAAAYCSSVDRMDEVYRPGLHVVVGRIDREPPEFHCEFVVDGARFIVPNEEVLEGYARRRRGVPAAWLSKVQLEIQPW